MEDVPSSTDNPPSSLGLWKHALPVGMATVLLWMAGLPLPALKGDPSPCSGLYLSVRGQHLSLLYPLRRDPQAPAHAARISRARLDTLSNWYSPSRRYVEIIRQDHPTQPLYGLALGFEFHESADTFPYRPAYARAHFKDFSWGGVEFSQLDSFNYTGVTNEVSHDLSIRILSFQNDTIKGVFSGLLLSGAGPMLLIDSGAFCVHLRRLTL
ncbi:MAG: hypothetical protein RMJ33_09535 [Saprospiraceae bacterium]|nr:hypothetical protein [Saprospiraceae bacterium]MDW8230066.1 hypothetical protein [Saprospiraceae bacterium]